MILHQPRRACTTDRPDPPPASVRIHLTRRAYGTSIVPRVCILCATLAPSGLRDDRPLDMSGIITVGHQSESQGPEMSKREAHVRKRFQLDDHVLSTIRLHQVCDDAKASLTATGTPAGSSRRSRTTGRFLTWILHRAVSLETFSV
jgi:hypothetical protein